MLYAFWIFAAVAGFVFGYMFRLKGYLIPLIIVLVLLFVVIMSQPLAGSQGLGVFMVFAVPTLVAYGGGGLVGAFFRRREDRGTP